MTLKELISKIPEEEWDKDLVFPRSYGETESGDPIDISAFYINQDCIVLSD